MARSIVLSSVLAALYLAACITPASADDAIYNFNGTLPTVSCTSTGLGSPLGVCSGGNTLEFTLPQFDPSLGTLQTVFFNFDIGGGTGGVTITPFPLSFMQVIDVDYGFTGSISTGGSNFQFGPCCVAEGGGQSFQAPDNPNLAFLAYDQGVVTFGSFSGFFLPEFSYSPPDTNAFVGTGAVTFDMASLLDVTDSSDPGITATLVQPFEGTMDYSYTPSPVPEPSLLAFTGGMFGLLAMRRMRSKRTSRSGLAT